MEYKLVINVKGSLSFDTEDKRNNSFTKMRKMLKDSGLKVGDYSLLLVDSKLCDFTQMEEERIVGHLDTDGNLVRHKTE